MKLRRDKIDVTDAQERDLETEVRWLATERAQEGTAPSATYFANLLVKTNKGIDRVTSGKALSISWLARVAVPGVVAILFFFIGLHYYKPEMSNGKNSVVETVKVLPESTVDSMLVSSIMEDDQIVQTDIFEVSGEQLAEYFIGSREESALLETIPEQQLNEVASLLETKATNL
jgi:hypothetical protein